MASRYNDKLYLLINTPLRTVLIQKYMFQVINFIIVSEVYKYRCQQHNKHKDIKQNPQRYNTQVRCKWFMTPNLCFKITYNVQYGYQQDNCNHNVLQRFWTLFLYILWDISFIFHSPFPIRSRSNYAYSNM